MWFGELRNRVVNFEGNERKMIPPTKAQFSFTVLNAIGSSIQSIQPNTPEDGHVDARNM